MGIQGLLPFLKKATKKSHIRHYSGCTAAVDAYGWLHKGAFGCAVKLGMGEPTDAYVVYCMKYVNVLLAHNVKPVLVFDGRNLPSKGVTEKKRREKRKENRERARKAMQQGDKKLAWECFTKSVDVTPEMARNLIKELRRLKVDYIIAPYEADAQMAYLARKGIVDMVITEDSDLVLFGCPRIFFKFSLTGDGNLFEQCKLPQCVDSTPTKFQFEKFRHMCILSGCDYLPSLPGIGLGRAKKVYAASASASSDIQKMLKSIPDVLQMDVDVTEEYISGFMQAENTFLYQIIMDPISRKLLPLTPYPPNIDTKTLAYAGAYEEKQLALDMALGNVDIHTLQRVDNFDPDRKISGYATEQCIWAPRYMMNKHQVKNNVASAISLKKMPSHSSTSGLTLRLNSVSILTKAGLVSNDHDDDAAINMYKSKSNEGIIVNNTGDEPDEIDSQSSNYEQVIKIKRIKLDDSVELEPEDTKQAITITNGSAEEEDYVAEADQANDRKRRRNPFLTSPDKMCSKTEKLSNGTVITETQRISDVTRKNPVCLIEKNEIYVTPSPSMKATKSRYFRSNDNKSEFEGHVRKIENSPTKASNRSPDKLKTPIKASSPKKENTPFPSPLKLDSPASNTRLRLRSDFLSQELVSAKKPDTGTGSKYFGNSSGTEKTDEAEIIELSDEEPFPPSLRKNFMGSNAKISHTKSTSSKPTRRIGLSRKPSVSAKKDPKQKDLRDMFAVTTPKTLRLA